MSFPASWARIPITATYLLRDEAGTPATGWVEFRSSQIVVADGSIIVPVRVTATLDSAGQISLVLPATDDPDIQPNSWTWSVTEIIDRQPRRSYSLAVPHTASSIDLSSISPIPPGSPVYDYLLTSAIGVTVAGKGDLDALDGRVTALENAGGGVQLSDDTPGSLGTASAGVSTKASRSDHVHEMPTAAQVGALAAGDGLAALDSAAAAKLAGIAAGADVNVNADWNASTGDAAILNKPTLGTAAAQNVEAFATAAQGTKADTALQIESDPTVPAWAKQPSRPSYTAADVGADPAGTAASAVTTHESAPDPHPQYTTAAEASAAAPVQSVQGQTGAVALTPADIGAATSTDPRLSDPREWTADTVTQGEAEAGTDTARKAWSVLRVWQAVAAWWAASSAKSKLDGIAPNATVGADWDVNVANRPPLGTAAAAALSDATPAALGTASPGTSADASRADHAHTLPTAADVGADPAGTATSAVTAHESAPDPHPQYLLEATAAAVATSGSYSDLTGRPTLGTAAAFDVTDMPASGEVASRLEALEAGQTAGMLGFATKSDMDADLAHDAGTLALVTNDPTPANNGTYRKTGSSGSGSWVLSEDRVTGLEQNAVAWTHLRYGTESLVQSGFIDASGDFQPSASWWSTPLLRVIGGDTYIITSATAGNARHAWYDAAGAFISSFGASQSSPLTVSAPASARFLRTSCSNGDEGSFSVLSGAAAEDLDRLRKAMTQHLIDLPAEKVFVDAEALPTVLDRIETMQARILSTQNTLANELDILTDVYAPWFVDTRMYTKSHATSTAGVERVSASRLSDYQLQVEAGKGVHFIANGAIAVTAADGSVTSRAVKSVAGDVLTTFDVLPAGLTECSAVQEANNGQHLSRLGHIGLAEYVIDQLQKYAYRKDEVLWQYHPPIHSHPAGWPPSTQIWNRDDTAVEIPVTVLGGAGNGGWVAGTTNLARGCYQESSASNVGVDSPSKYLSRAYVLLSGAAGDGFELQVPVGRRDGFVEVVVAGTAESYVSSDDSQTYQVNCLYRLEVVDSNSATIHDEVYRPGEVHAVAVDFTGADYLTVRVTQTESKPSSVRLCGIYAYPKSPATPVTPLFKGGDVIAFLGDSWTQHPTALLGETRPLRADGSTADGMCYLSEYMRTKLASRGVAVTTLNMGKGGTTSAWGRHWVGEIIALDPKPTHCVLSFCINDNNSLSYHTADTDSPYDFDPDDMWAFKVRSAGGIKGSLDNDMWFANMKAICDRLLSAGIKPVVLMPPHTGSVSQTATLQQRYLDKIAVGFRNDNESGGGE